MLKLKKKCLARSAYKVGGGGGGGEGTNTKPKKKPQTKTPKQTTHLFIDEVV